MKYAKVLRIFSIAIILSLLVAAAPVMAQDRFIVLSPEEGKIGDKIEIGGEGFNESTDLTERYANIYFSSDEANTLHDIDDEVTHYEILKEGQYLDYDGAFEDDFNVPAELSDGDDEEDVEIGTYYVYVCHYGYNRIRAVVEFTVVGGEIEIDPESGPVGTEVEIDGVEFGAEKDITVEYELARFYRGHRGPEMNEFIQVIRVNYYYTKDFLIKLFVQSNTIIDKLNIEALVTYWFLPPSGFIQLVGQVGRGRFGEKGTHGNTLFFKINYIF